jgi:hypothetical protein
VVKFRQRLEVFLRAVGESRWVGPLLFLVFALRLALVEMPHADLQDFKVFHAAGAKAVLGETVYDVAGHFQYKYAPWVALLFGYTVSAFDLYPAYIFCFFAFLATWGLCFRLLEERVSGLLLAVLFFSNSLQHELLLGQINSVPMLAFVTMFLLLARDEREPGAHRVSRETHRVARETIAGLLFCFAFSFKLVFLIAGPWLLLRKRYLTLVTAAAGFTALNLGLLGAHSGLTFALSESMAWLVSLTRSTAEILTIEGNISILGLATKVLGHPLISQGLWLAAFAAYGMVQYQLRAQPAPFQLALQSSALVLLSPISWPNWVLFAAPALLWLWDRRESMGLSRGRWAGAAVFVALSFQLQSKFASNGPKAAAIALLLVGLWIAARKDVRGVRR